MLRSEAQRAYATEFVRRSLGASVPSIRIPDDLLALVFRELSRQEEIEIETRDQWGNWEWPFAEATRNGTLYLPVVDDRLLQWALTEGQDPSLVRPFRWPEDRPFALCLTHDVDFIARRSTSIAALGERLRRIATVPVRQRSSAAHNLLRETARFALGPTIHGGGSDEYHNFDTWMDAEADHGFASTFFFIAEHLSAPHSLDTGYDYGQRIRYRGTSVTVTQLMRDMLARGWEVGLHGSIRAATELDALIHEKRQLDQALGVPVQCIRHHYLTYDVAITPTLHSQAGFLADSTQGFNRNIGFRAGTSLPYFCWDHSAQQSLSVVEIPMVIQDVALFGAHGLECDAARARDYILALMDAVERVGGCLTVNWHPNWWSDARYADSYLFLLAEARRRGAWGCSVGDLARRTTAR